MIVFLESLGCSRNQVDSELMLGRLASAGHRITQDPKIAEAIIVNTCTFISTASDEAVDVILEMAEYKQRGNCRQLVVTGCLAERYKNDPDLAQSLPEVDVFLGTGATHRIVDAVEKKEVTPLTLFEDPEKRDLLTAKIPRKLLSETHAYVKVSEGCSRKCTYCIIPTLRGRQRSKPISDICSEAENLVDSGVREIILTAENTTDYGQDLMEQIGFENVLAALSDRLKSAPAWIRFLYTHPTSLTRETIQTVHTHDNICSYYDVPIQHTATAVLKRMGRPYTTQQLHKLFAAIREIDAQAALRTTVIVGFPGETKADFKQLLEFIKEVKFDHLGVFTYSDSEDLASHHLKDHVPEQITQQRHDTIMAAQAQISENRNQQYVERVVDVLVEENPEPGLYLGRTRFQAPEVDGVTFIYENDLELNTVVKVRITDAFEYDIAGELA